MRRVVVALSGGRDSVYLLHRLAKHSLDLSRFGIDDDYELGAIHVHHHIRKASDEDEVFVTKLCKKLHVPLQIVHVDAPRLTETEKLSLEDAARRLRYDAFEKTEGDCIALAHHAGDQAETILMHLLRGAGLKGLTGMQAMSTRGGKTFIRPILSISRDEINEYIAEHNLFFREDESNADTNFTRNGIRHELIPFLEEHYNPRLVESLCRTGLTLQEDEKALLSWAQEAYQKMGRALNTSQLADLPVAIQKRIFALHFCDVTDFTKEHFDALVHLVNSQNGTKLNLPGNLTVLKDCDIICIQNCLEKPTTTCNSAAAFLIIREPVPEGEKLKNPMHNECWLDLSAEKPLQQAVLRKPQSGDFFYILNENQEPVRKLLSDFFTDKKVPQADRAQTDVLAVDGEVLWVVGYRASARFYVNANASNEAFHIVIS